VDTLMKWLHKNNYRAIGMFAGGACVIDYWAVPCSVCGEVCGIPGNARDFAVTLPLIPNGGDMTEVHVCVACTLAAKEHNRLTGCVYP
jgi:hypothetical protein